jgi:hypothetical protein
VASDRDKYPPLSTLAGLPSPDKPAWASPYAGFQETSGYSDQTNPWYSQFADVPTGSTLYNDMFRLLPPSAQMPFVDRTPPLSELGRQLGAADLERYAPQKPDPIRDKLYQQDIAAMNREAKKRAKGGGYMRWD